MRAEATLEQWRALYDIVDRIRKLEPWKRLGTMDIITIPLEGHSPSPYYFNVVGKTSEVRGIYMYQGCEGLDDLYYLAEAGDTGIPVDYLLGNQNFLAWYQGSRYDVPEPNREAIEELGLKYSGEDDWPYFLSYKKGYIPWTPDAEETQKLIEGLAQFERAYEALRNEKIDVNFEGGETLVHGYDEDEDDWYDVAAPLDICTHKMPAVRVASEDLIQKIRDKEQRDDEIWEIDLFYGNAPVFDEEYDRPINPKILALADQKTGGLIDHDMLSPNDEQAQAVYGLIVDTILNNHRPSGIVWRSPAVGGILSDLLGKAEIKSMHRKQLPVIDELIRDFRRKIR